MEIGEIPHYIASGGRLSCFGKKVTKEADQGEALRNCSRNSNLSYMNN